MRYLIHAILLFAASTTTHAALTAQRQPLAASGTHTCAVHDGNAYCWGDARERQLGIAVGLSSAAKFSTVPVRSTGTGDIAAVSAARDLTCAIDFSGALFCWGSPADLRLGDGNETRMATSIPTRVRGMSALVSHISAAAEHVCAVRDGYAYCWGSGSNGRLGTGNSEPALQPKSIASLAGGVTSICTGAAHSCAVQAGKTLCWGSNSRQQLGANGTSTPRLAPTVVKSLDDSHALSVACGSQHTCVITAATALLCFGRGTEGQLGDGGMADRTSAALVNNLDTGVFTVSAGELHTCAIKGAAAGTGELFCWGSNGHKQLGAGPDAAGKFYTPARVTSLAMGATYVACGNTHTCVAHSTLGVFCFGEGALGRLGTNSTGNAASPSAVVGLQQFQPPTPAPAPTAPPTTAVPSFACSPVDSATLHCAVCTADRCAVCAEGYTPSPSAPRECIGGDLSPTQSPRSAADDDSKGGGGGGGGSAAGIAVGVVGAVLLGCVIAAIILWLLMRRSHGHRHGSQGSGRSVLQALGAVRSGSSKSKGTTRVKRNSAGSAHASTRSGRSRPSSAHVQLSAARSGAGGVQAGPARPPVSAQPPLPPLARSVADLYTTMPTQLHYGDLRQSTSAAASRHDAYSPAPARASSTPSLISPTASYYGSAPTSSTARASALAASSQPKTATDATSPQHYTSFRELSTRRDRAAASQYANEANPLYTRGPLLTEQPTTASTCTTYSTAVTTVPASS